VRCQLNTNRMKNRNLRVLGLIFGWALIVMGIAEYAVGISGSTAMISQASSGALLLFLARKGGSGRTE